MSSNFDKKIFDSCDKIVSIEDIAENIYSVILEGPPIAQHVQPGQFVMIRVVNNDQYFPLLRRAFSVARILDDRHYELLVQSVGTGTKVFRKHHSGECIKVIGPLGTHFSFEKSKNKNVKIVVGGIGVAPAFILFDKLRSKVANLTIYYGVRSKKFAVPMKELAPFTKFASEDGTIGDRGYVTDVLLNDLEKESNNLSNTIIYACGPNQMLQALERVIQKYPVKTEVSVETLMACGIGVCMGCPVEKKNSPGNYFYACKDGPVFPLDLINLSQAI